MLINPVMYQDPSGHAGLFSKIVSAVKSTVKKVVKTVTKTVKSVAKKVTSTVKKATSTVKKAVTTAAKKVTTTVKKTVSKVKSTVKKVTTTVKKVVNIAKQAVAKAATVVVNKAKSAAKTVIRTVSSAAEKVQSVYEDISEDYEYVKETVSRYVSNKVKEVKQQAAQVWEDTKDVLEDGLAYVIEAKETAAECVQQAAIWWEESSLSKKLTDTAESLCAAWKDSPIGKTVAAISTQVNKAAQYIGEKWNNSPAGQFCQKAANSISEFYEEHKTAINAVIGFTIVAVCFVGMVATGGMTCCLMATAAKGAFLGSLIGGGVGAAGGAIDGAADYMEEHGTLDGATSQVLEGAAVGFAKGVKTGAEIGYSVNSMRYMKNPNGFCFVAGTLVLTTLGFSYIEDIRPGDYVYAKNEITGEQDYMPVLETFENEVTELCTVTIDGNSIETTPGHKFYTPDNGWVSVCNLKKGDTVEVYDGSGGEVESVETTQLDEPITVYNFNVMDYHTYYISDSEVLVHNAQCKHPKASSDLVQTTSDSVSKAKGWKVGEPIDNLTKAGKEPSWSTVKSRYWKNEAYNNPDLYSGKNIELMKKGKAPRHNTIDVPKELHHINGRKISNPHNINNLKEVWPWEHAEIDPFRHYTGARP